jgi:hypothetical protein
VGERLPDELLEQVRALVQDAERAATLISRMKEERSKLELRNRELERKLGEWEERAGSGDVKEMQERIRRLERDNQELCAERDEILHRLEGVLEKFSLLETA